MANKTIRAIKQFYHEREIKYIGDIFEVPENKAKEYISTNKAEFCDPPAKVELVKEKKQKAEAVKVTTAKTEKGGK